MSGPYHYVLDQLGAMVAAAEGGQGPRPDPLAARGGPRHRAHPAPGPPGRHQWLLQRPAGRRPPPGRPRAVVVVVGALLRFELQRDRPARRAGIWEERGDRVTFCLESTAPPRPSNGWRKSSRATRISRSPAVTPTGSYSASATPAEKPVPGGPWHKPPSRLRRRLWGRHSGRTRRSGRPLVTTDAGCASLSWPVCRTRQSPTGGSRSPPSIGAISTISGGGITPIVTARRDYSSRS